MKHLKTWIMIALLVALIAGSVAYAMLKPGPAVDTAEVRSGPIEAYVEERARTHLPRVYRITMPLDGRIEPITLEPGTPVAAGDVLARLDTRDLDTAVAVARAELDRIDAEIAVLKDNALAETALAEAKGWVTTMDGLASAAAEVIKAHESNAAFSAWWQDAEAKLKARGAVADEQYRRVATERSRAEVELAVSKLNHDVVGAIKQIFELGPKYVTEWLKLKTLELAVLGAEREAAVAALDEAERNRARAELKSPVAGVVLSRALDNEQVLPAGAELLAIGDPAGLQVVADILSEDATRIRAGDAVQIYGAALGDAQLAGKVIRVHPQAFTKVSSLGVDQQRVTVDIALADDALDQLAKAGLDLGIDYRVYVRVIVDRADDALVVPRLALFRTDADQPAGPGPANKAAQWQVYRIVAGKAEPTPVQLGLGNPIQVQVTDGLSAGDLVIVTPPTGLVAGAKVTPSP
jgi:HlyD family secretion protein